MSNYICIAYRWGDINNHWYILYVGCDLMKARALASNEPQDRGGKYGAAVLEYVEEDGEGGTRLIDYYPSMSGEKRPAHNYRIDFFRDLGHRADDAVRDGKAWLPNPAEPGFLHYAEVECPQWLKDWHASESEKLRLMEEAQDTDDGKEAQRG